MGLDFDFRRANENKRYVRTPKSPFDLSTVISIFPKDVSCNFITLEPGYFTIKKGSVKSPSLLTIGISSWWNDQGPGRPSLEIQVSSFDVATSIIRDSCSSMIGFKTNEKQPGLFFVPGKVDLAKLLTDHKAELKRAEEMQTAWYEELIHMADVDWSRAQGNPLCIHDDSRIAATEMGRKDKPWMGTFVAQELLPCPACGMPRNPKFPVCPSCHNIVDVELFKKIGAQQQKVG
jgi:hypothetical protein